jgi:hypothetical protein
MRWRDHAQRCPGTMRQLCRLSRDSADEPPHTPALLGFSGKISLVIQFDARILSLHR